ncbi:MAG: efflux RND transporter periplasmic adaptor subunit [Desulfuromonadaceae bacterium]
MPFICNFRMITLAVLLSAGLLLTACERQEEAVAPPQAPPPEVAVLTIETQSVQLTTELPGRTASFRVAEVRPQVGGIIEQRLFTEGADVRAGQELYRIDPASYQASYDRARAELARAEANLAPLRLKAERFNDLVKINAVSRQDCDDVAAALKQAEADILAAKAAVESARIDLEYTRLQAPISGRIGRSAVTNGALVKAEQDQPLATIQQLDPIYVDVTQSSSDLLKLKRSLASGLLQGGGTQQAKARLLLEDGTPYAESGTLKFSEVMVEPSTGSVTLRTLFSNPQQLLLPGMFVRVVLDQGLNDQAILVPQQAVTRNQAGDALVLLVGAGEQVEQRRIEVARTLGDDWLVSDGLQPGDRVIMEGSQRVRPGTEVRTVAFARPAAEAPVAGE